MAVPRTCHRKYAVRVIGTTMDTRMTHLMIEKSKNFDRKEGRSIEAVMARLSLSGKSERLL